MEHCAVDARRGREVGRAHARALFEHAQYRGPVGAARGTLTGRTSRARGRPRGCSARRSRCVGAPSARLGGDKASEGRVRRLELLVLDDGRSQLAHACPYLRVDAVQQRLSHRSPRLARPEGIPGLNAEPDLAHSDLGSRVRIAHDRLGRNRCASWEHMFDDEPRPPTHPVPPRPRKPEPIDGPRSCRRASAHWTRDALAITLLIEEKGEEDQYNAPSSVGSVVSPWSAATSRCTISGVRSTRSRPCRTKMQGWPCRASCPGMVSASRAKACSATFRDGDHNQTRTCAGCWPHRRTRTHGVVRAPSTARRVRASEHGDRRARRHCAGAEHGGAASARGR